MLLVLVMVLGWSPGRGGVLVRAALTGRDGTGCSVAAFAAHAARVNGACCPAGEECAHTVDSLPSQCAEARGRERLSFLSEPVFIHIFGTCDHIGKIL